MPPSVARATLVKGPAQTTKKPPSHRLKRVFSAGCCTNSTRAFRPIRGLFIRVKQEAKTGCCQEYLARRPACPLARGDTRRCATTRAAGVSPGHSRQGHCGRFETCAESKAPQWGADGGRPGGEDGI